MNKEAFDRSKPHVNVGIIGKGLRMRSLVSAFFMTLTNGQHTIDEFVNSMSGHPGLSEDDIDKLKEASLSLASQTAMTTMEACSIIMNTINQTSLSDSKGLDIQRMAETATRARLEKENTFIKNKMSKGKKKWMK